MYIQIVGRNKAFNCIGYMLFKVLNVTRISPNVIYSMTKI